MSKEFPKINEELEVIYRSDYVKLYKSVSATRLKRLHHFFDLNKEMIVVDFGCGDGQLLNIIHNDIAEYHGVDFSKSMIDSAIRETRKINLKKSFYCSNINNFTKKNLNKFDVAFALDFSEHVYDDEWLKILINIKKTLRPHGTLYLHTPNAEYFYEILKDRGILKQNTGHIAVRGPEENLKLLEKAGFININLNYLSHYQAIHKVFSFFTWVPIIGKYFKARLFISANIQAVTK